MSGVTSSIRIGPRMLPQRLCRTDGPLLQDVLELAQPVADPLDRRRPEDLLPAAPQPVDLGSQGFDPPFGVHQSLRERLPAAAFANEVDEIRHVAARQS